MWIGTHKKSPRKKWVSVSSVSTVAQSCLTLGPHEPQHARPPCPSPPPGVHPNPCPLSRWCHPTISSSVIPFSSCPQSFAASGSFLMSQFFASGDHSIAVSASASVLPMNIQDRFLLGWTGWISLQSKGLSKVFKFITESNKILNMGHRNNARLENENGYSQQLTTKLGWNILAIKWHGLMVMATHG